MGNISSPIDSKVSIDIQCPKSKEYFDNQIPSCGSVGTSKREDTPKLCSQWQLLRNSSSHPCQSRFFQLFKSRFPKCPGEESLPAACTIPSSGGLTYPEHHGVTGQRTCCILSTRSTLPLLGNQSSSPQGVSKRRSRLQRKEQSPDSL